jgi:hypothetical protein
MGYFETLKEEIIERSTPNNLSFLEAKAQWSVETKYKVSFDDAQDCLCGYNGIVNLNVLRNNKNGNDVIVGSCCVKQFEFTELLLFCVECKKMLGYTNKYVKSLLDNNIRLTKDSRIVGHKKCCEKVKKDVAYLLTTHNKQLLFPHIYNPGHFTYLAKRVVDYFNGMITEISSEPSGVGFSYHEDYEDYLLLVMNECLQ